MYTILMNADGSLLCTTPNVKLYQTESMVDNLHFILPKIYKDVDLTDYTISLKYINPANISKLEILVLNNNNYKNNFLEYKLPVTTELTKFAGDITLYLTMTKYDSEINTKYISHSSEAVVPIYPVDNYFTDENSLQAVDRQILQLQEIAAEYDKNKADNIVKNNDEVYLTSNGEKIGDSIIITGEMEAIEFDDKESSSGDDNDSGYEEAIEF